MWTRSQLLMLSNLFGRYKAFPSNGREDEFIIVREDGRRQGIFKEWAPPILPLLSGHEIEEWRMRTSSQPAFLEKELRRAWRNSWLIDRNLAIKFATRPLSENPEQRVSEVVGRLKQAFGLMAPFYHLEAVVDDPAWFGMNQETQPLTGELDVAAFLLPSALQQYVVAMANNWNGLNWPEIHRLTTSALASPLHVGILLGLAGLLGVPPEHLIFAANALQWIPTRVGGKKGDIGEREAINDLKQVIEKSRKPKDLDFLSVLADMNARIRFFNWLPLIKGPKNFDGLDWTYASVCDTANELFRTLDAYPELWQSDFRDVYTEKLRPQILNLDAASAKGRFLLDIIVNERRLAGNFVDKQINQYYHKHPVRLVFNATHEFNQSCLVGTKPVGLTLASYVLGKEHVLPGLVISTETIEGRHHKGLAKVARTHWPDIKLWAVRSSSMDEGTARGVYETVLCVAPARLDNAIEACIKSYNHDGAVAFRRARGPNDQDCRIEIAVLLQPYQTGTCGGVAVITNSSNTEDKWYQISVARTAEEVTSGGKTREFGFSSSAQVPHDLIPLVSTLERLHNIFGGAIQTEWTMDNTGKVIILQMEFMPTMSLEDSRDQRGNEQITALPISSPADIRKTIALVETRESSHALRLVISHEIDARSFQGELFMMVVRLGRRIKEISLANQVSPSSHFANICRHFGIRLI